MNEFVMPCINYYGQGCLSKLNEIIHANQLTKGLIITDAVLDQLGYTQKIQELVDVELGIFNKVQPNPTKENVYEALEQYQSGNYDFIIGLGGGSANDCSKAVSVLATNDVKLTDLVGPNKSEKIGAFLICVNTTAGTASEISRAYLISDNETQEKLIAKDIHALPRVAFNDTDLMINLPKSVTAMTGMDALTHAIEAYVSNGHYGLTREFAISAMHLIFNNLKKAVDDGKNIEARDNMIYAATLAGMAFCNSGVGLVHAMAHQLSALYDLPHGLSNAVLLPAVLKANCKVVESDYATVARRLFNVDMDDHQAASYFIQQVEELSQSINTFKPLRELKVKEDDIELLAEKTLKDGNIYRNPFMPTKQEIMDIFESVF